MPAARQGLAAEKKGEQVAMQVERADGLAFVKGQPVPPALPLEQWTKWTFAEYYAECRVAARAFMALGLERFDGVNIFGFNSPEWFVAVHPAPPADHAPNPQFSLLQAQRSPCKCVPATYLCDL